jgi:hypothetical protein
LNEPVVNQVYKSNHGKGSKEKVYLVAL